MEIFRLMGIPDKMIAFEGLPKDLLEGVEMVNESRMPRHWREFIGIREKFIRIPPEKDPMTGAVRTFQPIVEKAPFTFVIDREINKDKERWQEIESYVRRNAPKDFRLLDKLEDMAKLMAPDAHSEMTLEPEEVLIIPLPKVEEDTGPKTSVDVAPPEEFKCAECPKAFSTKQGLRLHKIKKHQKEEVKA